MMNHEKTAKSLSLFLVMALSCWLCIKPQILLAANNTQGVETLTSDNATSQPLRHHIRISEKKDDLEKILKKCHFSKSDIQSIRRSSLLPEDYRILPQSSYLVTFYSRTDEVDVKIYEPDISTAWLFRKRGAKVSMDLVQSDLESGVRKFKGQIGGNLLHSIRRVIPDDRVAQKFQSAYVLDFTPEQISQLGAKFEFTVEEQYYKSNFVKYGELLSLSLEINGITETRNFVKFPRGGAFMNPKDGLTNRPLYSPVEYLRVTSFFNLRRFHPIRRRYLPHRGVDFALPKGEPVYAAADGVIEEISRSRGGGKHVKISHANGLETSYEHLNEYEQGLKIGDKVEAGQRIARVGCTGFCTSPHLHFGVKLEGEFVDPVYYTRPYPFNKVELIADFYEKVPNQSQLIGAELGPEDNVIPADASERFKLEKSDSASP